MARVGLHHDARVNSASRAVPRFLHSPTSAFVVDGGEEGDDDECGCDDDTVVVEQTVRTRAGVLSALVCFARMRPRRECERVLVCTHGVLEPVLLEPVSLVAILLFAVVQSCLIGPQRTLNQLWLQQYTTLTVSVTSKLPPPVIVPRCTNVLLGVICLGQNKLADDDTTASSVWAVQWCRPQLTKEESPYATLLHAVHALTTHRYDKTRAWAVKSTVSSLQVPAWLSGLAGPSPALYDVLHAIAGWRHLRVAHLDAVCAPDATMASQVRAAQVPSPHECHGAVGPCVHGRC